MSRNFSYIFDLDGVLWRTREMFAALGEALYGQGVLADPNGIFELYQGWKRESSQTRGTFTEGFPKWLARNQQTNETVMGSIVREIYGRNWTDPEAGVVLSQFPKERVFILTCGDPVLQKEKVEKSGLIGSILDWNRITIVLRKDEAAFLRAREEMGIPGGMIHVNDRLDELVVGQKALSGSIPVWLGDRKGEQYGGHGKEMEELFSPPAELSLRSLIRIASLSELPHALREKQLL